MRDCLKEMSQNEKVDCESSTANTAHHTSAKALLRHDII